MSNWNKFTKKKKKSGVLKNSTCKLQILASLDAEDLVACLQWYHYDYKVILVLAKAMTARKRCKSINTNTHPVDSISG